MTELNTRQIAAVLLVLLTVVGGAAAYTAVFTGGAGGTYEAPSGLEVTAGVDHGVDDANPFNDTSTIYIAGVEFSSDAGTAVTVDQFTGTTTDLSSIDATNDTITVDPDDKSAVYIDGSVTALSWEDAALDGTSQLTYSASGSGTITATGLPADTGYAAATPSGEVLTTGTTTSSGEATISVDSATDQDVVLLEPSAPTVSNASPADASDLTDRDQTFEIDVNDTDFATDAGDTINASLFVDDAYVDSDTMTSNGTASVTATISEGGEHSYYWVAEDAYGETTTSATRTINIPSELRIYNTSSLTLVDNATVELRMYANETGASQVYERNPSDGTINMTGLPADQPFIVVAETENYTNRRIFVPSLYETQSIYLLPASEQPVETIFSIDDYTGQFPKEESVLMVQRSLNGSYKTVLGDYFGATGQFPAQVKYNTRHRLVLRNIETGETRRLGTYTPLSASTQTVVVTPTGVERIEGEGISVRVTPSIQRLPAIDGAEIGVSVTGGDLTIENWTATAQLVNATGATTELWTTSESGPGNVSATLDLADQEHQTLEVVVTWTTESGATATDVVEISLTETFDNDATLLGALGNLADLSPPGSRSSMLMFLSMLITVFAIAAVASVVPSGEIAGLTGIFFLTGFAVIGWVGYDIVFVGAVGYVSLAAIARGL